MKISEKFALASPLYWPAWLGLGLFWLTTRLPDRLRLRLGKSIGRFFYYWPNKFKHITSVNIKLCFPELSAAQQKALVKKNFESLGIGLIETAMAWWTPDDKLLNTFTVKGLEHVEKALQRGKGIILLGPHFTSLEIIGRLLGLQYRFAVMYRPHKKPLVSFIQERFRKQHYLEYIPRHNMRQLIRALNSNLPIWYAYDIDGGHKNSVFAPFFGVETASLTSVSRIVRMSDCAIIPISFYRDENDFRYEIILSPQLENFPTSDFKQDAAMLNASVEKAIREKPEDYLWQYKRFKTRPKNEKRFY